MPDSVSDLLERLMDTTTVLYGVSELAALLLCVVGYLMFHMRGLKRLVKELEQKILSLRETIKTTKENAKNLVAEARSQIAESLSYLDYLDKQINNTKEFHKSQDPDKDIVLDLDLEVSAERRAAALRNVFLLAEKEAALAGDEDDPNWDVLKAKQQQILGFYEKAYKDSAIEELERRQAEAAEEADTESESVDEALQEELNNYKKRVDNLEKFKKLFFDMEAKWEAAKKEAATHHSVIQEQARNIEGGEDINAALEQYAAAYSEVDQAFQDGLAIDSSGGAPRSGTTLVIEGGAKESSTSHSTLVVEQKEEVERLRALMENQHEIITELKRKLREVESVEEKDQLLEQMAKEMDKQERFMRESETCITLLEEELSMTRRELMEVGDELKRIKSDPASINGSLPTDLDTSNEEEVETLIAGYVAESRDMLNTISLLEQENQILKDELKIAQDSGGDSSEETLQLRAKLSEVQQELLNLQTQHIELEERYIELKTSG